MPKPDIEPTGLIEKILKLEKVLGAYTNYNILEPFPLHQYHDAVILQNTARTIADFIGLKGFNFVVGFSGLQSGVAGQIELKVHREDQTVFIDLNKQSVQSEAALLAVLAHELTHQYLHIRYIKESENIENEVLTDIAAVYVGLGKILLNGYFTSANNSLAEMGYISFSDLAYVYKAVCCMRGIPREEFMENLTPASVEAVSSAVIDVRPMNAGSGLAEDHGERQRCSEALGQLVRAQYLANYVNFCIRELGVKLKQQGRSVQKLTAELDKYQQDINPNMRYLGKLMNTLDASRYASKLDDLDGQSRELLNQMYEIADMCQKLSGIQLTSYNREKIQCPVCGSLISTEVKELLQCNCRKCGAVFPFVSVMKGRGKIRSQNKSSPLQNKQGAKQVSSVVERKAKQVSPAVIFFAFLVLVTIVHKACM